MTPDPLPIPGPIRGRDEGPPRNQDRRALEACARILRTWPDPLDSGDVDDALDQIGASLGWTMFNGGHAEARRRHETALRAQRENDERRDLPGLVVPPPGVDGHPANRLERIERLELAFNVLRSAHGERIEGLELAFTIIGGQLEAQATALAELAVPGDA